MKFLAVLGLLAMFFVAGRAEEEQVLTLTIKDFDSTLKDNEVIMVEFYAPWCGHCKNLAPKYEAAAVQLKGIASLAKVDCTVEADICQRYDVKGYPTVKVFRGGKPSDYQGARETDAIVSFMKKQLLPALSILENVESVEKFSSSDRVVIVGFFESSESEAYKTFSSVANSLRDDFIFGATTDKSSFEKFGASSPQDIILFKKFDEGKNDFDGEFEEDDIIDFIKKYSVPLMDDVGPQNYQSYMEAGIPLAYLFVSGEEDRSTVGKQVEKVAAEFKGKINFVYIDANQYGGHANNLNLKVGEWPSFAIQDPTKNLKFPFSGAISTESIREFCNGVVTGEISPSLKSQPIPTEQGPVYTVVGKNYHEVVNSGKNVLIEFYAPWCGHCKKLAPIYDDLGKIFENDNEVIIAKMDATENDLPADAPFQIQGFPTIKFIKSDGTIIDYNGDRTLDNFKSFIEQNAIKGAASSDSDATGSAQKEEL